MSTTPQTPPEASFFSAIREWDIVRGPDGVLGGIVDGVSTRVGLATGPARIIVVILAVLLNGLVLAGYAAAWALLPDSEGRIIIQDFGRGAPNVGALVGIGFFALVGLGSLDSPRIMMPQWDQMPWSGGDGTTFAESLGALVFGLILPLAVLAAIAWGVVYIVKQNSAAGSSPAVPPGSAAADPSPPPAATAADPSPVTTSADFTTPPSAPTPHIPGPGRTGYLATLAWVFLSVAGVMYADRTDQLAVASSFAWFVVFTTGLGVIALGVALTGRNLGFLGFVATVCAASLLITLAATDNMRETFDRDQAWLAITRTDDGREAGLTIFGNELVFNTSVYFDDYDEVHVDGICRSYDPSTTQLPASDVVLTVPPSEHHSQFDVTVNNATIITGGASVQVASDSFRGTTVYFPDRALECWVFVDQGNGFRAIRDDEPVATVNFNPTTSGDKAVIIKESA